MDSLFSNHVSVPIRENDTVILMDHNRSGRTVKIVKGKTVKMCKDVVMLETLIGCAYGDVFAKDGDKWVRIKRNDPSYHIYRNRIREESPEESTSQAYLNKDIFDSNTAQKLTHSEIQQMKKDMNAQDLIGTIVDNSETFQKKTKMAQEKYIRRKEARHVKLFYIRPCDLYNVCDSYFNSFPHKTGYLNFANLGMMLFLANIRYGDKVMVMDHSLGLLTGAVAQRLAGSGKIYRLVTKGVSDKIVHELGIKYFDNIISIAMDEYIPLELSETTEKARESHKRHAKDLDSSAVVTKEDAPCDKISISGENDNALEVQSKAKMIEVSECGNQPMENAKRPWTEDDSDDDTDEDRMEEKKQILPGIYPLHHPSKEEVSECQVIIGSIAFNKCDRLNRVFDAYAKRMKKAADSYLELGGRIVIFGQQYQPMAALQAALALSSSYVNVKFDEMFIREYQMAHLRTHPLMRGVARPFCGYILSATKASSNII